MIPSVLAARFRDTLIEYMDASYRLHDQPKSNRRGL